MFVIPSNTKRMEGKYNYFGGQYSLKNDVEFGPNPLLQTNSPPGGGGGWGLEKIGGNVITWEKLSQSQLEQ